MTRRRRIGAAGGLVACVVAAAPFAFLWVLQVTSARDPLTARARLELAIWMTIFATPAMVAAWLVWRAGWRQAGDRLAALDGPGWLLAVAVAALPAGRRGWGQAMAAELAQVPDRRGRWRFTVGCARTAVLVPGGRRGAVAVAGVLAVGALAVVAVATGAVLPAGRVFGLVFVGLLGGLATLAVARSPGTGGTGGTGGAEGGGGAAAGPAGAGRGGPGVVVSGLSLIGVLACLTATSYYLAEHPFHVQLGSSGVALSLPPLTAVVLAVVLAGGVWLALRPPRWLVPDRHGRRFAIAMAAVLGAGFLLASRQELRSAELDTGVMGYLFAALPVVLLAGSVAAAAAGRSFRAGLWACAWAVVLALPVLVAAWLTEALRWHRQRGQLLLDGEGGLGLGADLVGANLGDAIWWTLVALVLWALPPGVVGAAAGSWRARRRRAREHHVNLGSGRPAR